MPGLQVQELVRRQQAATTMLLGGDDDEKLLATARFLGVSLRELVDADGTWLALEGMAPPAIDQGRLALLVSLDWEPILDVVGYQPPPASDQVAFEVAAAVGAAASSHGAADWSTVRELLRRLASQLDQSADSPAPPAHRRWWRSLRDKVAYAGSALHRVTLAALLTGATKEMAKDLAKNAVLAGLGLAAFGPAGAFLAVAAGGLASATVTELRRAFADEAAERSGDRLASLYDAHALHDGEIGRKQSDLKTVALMFTELPCGTDEVPETAVAMLHSVRDWASVAGAELVSAWSFVAVHTASRGLAYLAAATDALGRLRAALAGVDGAMKTLDPGKVTAMVEVAVAAVDLTRDAIHALEKFLLDQKLMVHPTH